MLRAAVASGSDLGRAAQTLMESGQLVPDDIVIGAVKQRLGEPDVQERGFLLDGFPRTPAQAEALKDMKLQIDCFVLLVVPDDLLVERVVGRRIDPHTGNSYHVDFNPPSRQSVANRVIQRADDTEEKVKVRLQAYHDNIAMIRKYFKNEEVEINGARGKEDVWKEIQRELELRRFSA